MEHFFHGRTYSCDLDIQGLLMAKKGAFFAGITGEVPFRLAPGQSRPLAFRLFMLNPEVDNMSLRIAFKVKGSSVLLHSDLISHTFLKHTIHEPHRLTFLHPGGVVSYAILRAPSVNASHGLSSDQALPVILSMHGAGLEAGSQQVRHMLDSVPDIAGWVLFPTGVTPWSGDDWRMRLQMII